MEAVFKGMDQSTLQIDNRQITILIVDDNEANLLLLDTVLKSEQYQVVQAQDGLEALVKVKETNPDLILLDIMMPNLDGYECCDRLKDNPDTNDIPIIFLSAKGKREDIIHGLELGAVDYMTKPFNRMELLLRVRTQIELKISRDRLRKLAMMDGLTGLYNHSYMHERLSSEISRAARHDDELSVVMFDIDYFKQVNDSWGHLVGDAVLRRVAKLMGEHIRQEDILGRYGGEEFLLILPQTNLDEAIVTADKIRQEVADMEWSEHSINITVSAGVVAWKNEDEPNLVEVADERLYAAKRGGRNRVVSTDDELKLVQK